jgi:hypothetical protein
MENGVVAHTCHPATVVKCKNSITVQARMSKKQDPISKITRAKRADGMTKVVEHLPSKCKALNSNSSTTK